MQVASDATFHEPHIDTTVEAKVTTVDAKDLPPERWFVRVSAVNEPHIDTTVEAKVTTVDAKDLPPGRWFVRVSAVNEDLVEGPFLGPGVVEIAKAQFTPAAGG